MTARIEPGPDEKALDDIAALADRLNGAIRKHEALVAKFDDLASGRRPNAPALKKIAAAIADVDRQIHTLFSAIDDIADAIAPSDPRS
ncbi:hypothetical protein JW805_15585 [Roseomonas aeriglobus]|nr:hypothetical protein [Roseomonas aeriglobus]